MPIPKIESKLKLTKAEREEFGQKLIERVRAARQGMRGLLDRLKDYDAFYKHDLPPKDFPWEDCANYNVPFMQWVIDTYHANTNDTILNVKPPIRIQPPPFASAPEVKAGAQRVQDALEHQMSEMDYASVASDIHLMCLRHPVGLVKLPWREDYRTVRTMQTSMDDYGQPEIDEAGQPVLSAVEQQVPKYRGPKAEFVDIRNFVIYPLTAASIEEAYMVGDRFRLTPEQVRERVKSGYFEREALELAERPENEAGRTEDTEDQEIVDFAGIERVDYDEIWFWELIAPWKGRDCVFTIDAIDGRIVRYQEFPYFHGRRYYIDFRPLRWKDSFFGGCLSQVCEHTQKELNFIHNIRSDATHLALSKCFLRQKGSEAEPDAIQMSPGGVIDVNSPDEITPLETDVKLPGMDIEQITRDYGERGSGVNDIFLGRQVAGDKTAFELQQAGTRGAIRFNDLVRRIQESHVEVAKQIAWLMYQFMEDSELQQLGVQREELILPWDYVPHGNTGVADKVQQKQESVFLYQTLLGAAGGPPNPLVVNDPLHVYRLSEKLLQAFEEHDVEGFIGQREEAGQMGTTLEQLSQVVQQIGQAVQQLMQKPQETGEGPGDRQAERDMDRQKMEFEQSRSVMQDMQDQMNVEADRKMKMEGMDADREAKMKMAKMGGKDGGKQ